MTDELFIGNLPHTATEESIREHFTPAGLVHSVTLMTDRKGRSRCFAFLQMENAEEAMLSLNEKEFSGRNLKISHAMPLRPPRSMEQRFHRRGR